MVQLVVLLLLELGLQIYIVHGADRPTFLRWASFNQLKNRNPDAEPLYSPHAYIGHYPTPGYRKEENRHNELGFRGEEIVIPKPEGEFRIVCLGGSTTYTSKVRNFRKSYPYQLGLDLRERGYENVNVINGGASGWSSWETLISFEFRVLDLEPDLVIVYHGINDVHPRLVWPETHYRGDNSGRRSPGQSILNSMPGVLEHSSLFRVIGIELGWIQSHSDFGRTILLPAPNYVGDIFRDQRHAGVYPAGVFEEITAAEILKANKPIYFERNIENLIAIAKAQNVKVLLSSFAFHPDFEDHPRASSREYIDAYFETNSMLKRVAAEQNVSFFDFAFAFPKDRSLYIDGRHVTEVGAQLKAKLFAEYLHQSDLLVAREAEED